MLANFIPSPPRDVAILIDPQWRQWWNLYFAHVVTDSYIVGQRGALQLLKDIHYPEDVWFSSDDWMGELIPELGRALVRVHGDDHTDVWCNGTTEFIPNNTIRLTPGMTLVELWRTIKHNLDMVATDVYSTDGNYQVVAEAGGHRRIESLNPYATGGIGGNSNGGWTPPPGGDGNPPPGWVGPPGTIPPPIALGPGYWLDSCVGAMMIFTQTDLKDYVGRYVVIEGLCFKVSQADYHPGGGVGVAISGTVTDCSDASCTPTWWLKSCTGGTDLYTTDDLSGYLGEIVKLSDGNCYYVYVCQSGCGTTASVTVDSNYSNCDACTGLTAAPCHLRNQNIGGVDTPQYSYDGSTWYDLATSYYVSYTFNADCFDPSQTYSDTQTLTWNGANAWNNTSGLGDSQYNFIGIGLQTSPTCAWILTNTGGSCTALKSSGTNPTGGYSCACDSGTTTPGLSGSAS